MNLFRDLPAGPSPPQRIYTVVEAPARSRNKYRYDARSGMFVLEKVVRPPIAYPVDYGFIPQTWYDDSAPLDVMMIVFEPTFPGCLVRCRPIGLLRMKESRGLDDKVLAVPEDEQRLADVKDIDSVPQHTKKEISHFFSEYKKLEEGVWAEVIGWEGRSEAERAIEHAMGLFKRKYAR